MFFLFDLTNWNLILGFVPESLGLLISGVGLVLLAISLRAVLRRTEERTGSKITDITQ